MTTEFYFGKCNFKYHGWSDNERLANNLWQIFNGKMVLVVFDNDHLSQEIYKERLSYYKETFDEKDKLGSLGFSDIYNIEYIKSYNLFPGIVGIDPLTVLRPLDANGLESVLTFTSGDETIHILSDDFTAEDIKDVFLNYAKNCIFRNYEKKLVDYLLDDCKHYFNVNSLWLVDTYCDDEDENRYFVISGNEESYRRAVFD
ncbi:hypothetical protein H0A36_11140 [Endozoicomonas sp. SM1973]|uniref:Uncharacterized protein n=1 Tax=Spartinivicinus marinus TaxID=2994442 RepID=A0A853HZF5_9GAMM|nr:hypothetical protein [Spartinivicinus marinus]MCX4026080.1 hypothetical protein [Spartinivicinus marinus]NYZ66563.1 hypothetical protein [Spartinivicinus marinus]